MPAYERLAEYVLPDGLMIEGTSTPYGQLWVANVARRLESNSLLFEKMGNQKQVSRVHDKWKIEAIVFSTNFHVGFEAQEFQTILPKNLIHRVVKGEIIYDFFQDWKQATKESSSAKTFGLKQWFIESAEKLSQKRYKIDVHKKWLSKGWLIWVQ